jgi:hypothetical protein
MLRAGLDQSRVVRRDVLEDGEVRDVEINPFLLLVYKKSFDVRKFKVGLKYNENWMNPVKVQRLMAAGVDYVRVDPPYSPIFDVAGAVEEDWRNAKRVEPLPLEVETQMNGDEMIGSIPSVEFPEIELYILSSESLSDFFNGVRGAKIFRYSVNGFYCYEIVHVIGDYGEIAEQRIDERKIW